MGILVPHLTGKALSFLPLGMILAMDFIICGLYYVDAHCLYIDFFESFLSEWIWNFVKCLFCLYWGDHMVFIFHFVNVVCHIDLWMLNSPYTWIKSHLIVLIYCWFWWVSILLWLHLYSSVIFACNFLFLWWPCLVLVLSIMLAL